MTGGRRQKGFTLIELMMVIAIIGVVLAIASFNFSRMAPSFRLRGGAEQIATRMQLVKMRAVATNRLGWFAAVPSQSVYTGFIDGVPIGNITFREFPRTELDMDQTLAAGSLWSSWGTFATFPAFRLPPGITFGLPNGYTSGAGPDGIAFPSKPVVTPESSDPRFIGFHPGGSARTAPFSAPVVPTSSMVVFLRNAEGEGYAVAVAPTGRVRVYQWSGGQWK